MQYREIGKTGLMASEIGLGAEWLERHTTEEVKEVIDYCASKGNNILDCWMSNPKVRSDIGDALVGQREKWIVQGQIGSAWIDGQYAKVRDPERAQVAFRDLLQRFHTDYMDIGMIHYCDLQEDWENMFACGFMDYVKDLKAKGIIKHIGMSTHNPYIGIKAVECGFIEMMLFSINPAFDILPVTESLDPIFDGSLYKDAAENPVRRQFYTMCEENGVGLTVMKSFAGGRLLNDQQSIFGKAMTPVQCIHYALTRPAVASVLTGVETLEQVDMAVSYETATEEEKDYTEIIKNAPNAATTGQCTYCGHCKPCPMDIDIQLVNKFYDLATMQPEVPESLRAHYKEIPHNADECIGCQDCETRCPFGVKIAERMQMAKELFG